MTVTVPKKYVANPCPGIVFSDLIIGVYLTPNQVKFFPHASVIAYDEALDGRDYIIQY